MSTAVYLDQIRQLVELQKVDDAIFAVRQELESAPRQLDELQAKFDASNAQRERIVEKLTHLQEQQKRLAMEIDDDSARIRKSKNKLMQVENTREYHAMMREMDSMEKINRSREEEKMTLMEEVQRQNEALAELDLTHGALQAELEVRRDGLEEKIQM
ncbi:zinc ribbon domain-containing protein, partial [Desulfovibrio piger]